MESINFTEYEAWRQRESWEDFGNFRSVYLLYLLAMRISTLYNIYFERNTLA